MGKESKILLDDYIYAMIKGFVEQAKALSKIKHQHLKGQLREVFTQNLLKHFLPAYLDVGSGMIINNRGVQSRQTDIIIYDNRLLPAFLFSDNMNIFPIESVVSVIELKSFLNRKGLIKAEVDAKYLMENIRENNNWLVGKPPHPILPCIFSLDGHRIKDISTEDDKWISTNIYHIISICSVGKFSWARIYNQKDKKLHWVFGKVDSDFKEIRRFIAILVDNLRNTSTQNWLWSTTYHNDWLGQYIRYMR